MSEALRERCLASPKTVQGRPALIDLLLYRFMSSQFSFHEHIEIRRHRLSGLDVCDVTMDELDSIERACCTNSDTQLLHGKKEAAN